MKFTVVDIEEIPVALVKAEGGVTQAPEAFAKLESRMESLRGKVTTAYSMSALENIGHASGWTRAPQTLWGSILEPYPRGSMPE